MKNAQKTQKTQNEKYTFFIIYLDVLWNPAYHLELLSMLYHSIIPSEFFFFLRYIHYQVLDSINIHTYTNPYTQKKLKLHSDSEKGARR